MRRNNRRLDLSGDLKWDECEKKATTAIQEQQCIESKEAPKVSMLSIAMQQYEAAKNEEHRLSPVNVISQQ